MKASDRDNIDAVVYLNGPARHFASRLRQALESAKVGRMPPQQWVAFINGLGGKGVKKDEIKDSQILEWLQGGLIDAPPADKALEKQAVLDALDRLAVTVKEVTLGKPQYAGWHHGGANDIYKEILFIANSERHNVEDRLEEVEYEMEEFSLDLSLLVENSLRVLALEEERSRLMAYKPTTQEFSWSHFTSNAVSGRHGNRLLGHARILISGDLFFIEEVQSDWGQRGRVKRHVNEMRRQAGQPELDWHPDVPRGPFVTDTKLWAGLIMRRLLQRAAMMPEINRVAWIRIGMKNGARVSPRFWETQQRAAAAARAARRAQNEESTEDNADHFYMRLIPSLADAALGKSGVKTSLRTEVIDGTTYQDIPGFEMTEAAREALKGVQPLYSAASVLRHPRPVPDQTLAELLRSARSMLGSTAHIHFVSHLYELSTMKMVSGSYMNKVIQVALNSSDIGMALDHEAYHFAHDQLLSAAQRRMMLSSFAADSELTARVHALLLRDHEPDAAAQCLRNPEDAAAHAFSYWSRGQLDLSDARDQGPHDLFEWIGKAIMDGIAWLRGKIVERELHTPESVFEALRRGDLARPAIRPQDELLDEPPARAAAIERMRA